MAQNQDPKTELSKNFPPDSNNHVESECVASSETVALHKNNHVSEAKPTDMDLLVTPLKGDANKQNIAKTDPEFTTKTLQDCNDLECTENCDSQETKMDTNAKAQTNIETETATNASTDLSQGPSSNSLEDSLCDNDGSIHNNDSGIFTDKSPCVTDSNGADVLASDLDVAASLSSDHSKDSVDNIRDDEDENDVYMDAETGELGHNGNSGGSSTKSSSSNGSGSESDRESCSELSDENRRRTTGRKRRVVLSSSSSESDNDDVDVENIGLHSSKSPKSTDSDSDVDKDPPSFTQNWFVLPELLQRERGYGNRRCTSNFRLAAYSSLQLVQRMKLHHKMEYHDGCVNALNFNRIGTLLASGSDDLNVCIWNWQENRPALTFESGHRSNVFQTKFIPYSGDCHVVTSSRDGQIRLAELSLTGVCKGTKKLAQHRGSAHKLTLFSDDPHVFLSCGEDAAVFELDLREPKPQKLTITKEKDKKIPLYSINSNPMNSNEFCTGGRDHFIRVYDRRNMSETEDTPMKRFCPHNLVNEDNMKANVTCAVFNYNGTEVMGTYNDEDIYLFDASHSDGADYIHRYTGHRNNATVKEVNFYGPSSEYVISGSDCGNVFMWDKKTENIVQYMHGDDAGVVNVLAPHPTAPILATSGLDHDVKIWTPSAYEPTKLAELRKTTEKNKTERDEERTHQPDFIDGQMLWFLMHLRRSARRRAREEGEEMSSSSDEDSEDSDDDSEMDDEGSRRLGCAQS